MVTNVAILRATTPRLLAEVAHVLAAAWRHSQRAPALPNEARTIHRSALPFMALQGAVLIVVALFPQTGGFLVDAIATSRF